jgi:hypothetical protein
MTPENRERLAIALRAIHNAFPDEHDAARALQFINPAVYSTSDDTQYTVAKMIAALSTSMHFMDNDALNAAELAGFGHILECCATALLVNVTRDEIRRDSKRPLKSIGAASK